MEFTILANISIFTSLKEAATNADLVIEAASENMAIKLDIFKQLAISLTFQEKHS